MDLKERFLKYVSYDTQSDENSTTFPSTEKQKVLLAALRDEMEALGMTEVTMDQYGYVMGTIPAAPECENAPVIGFIAHVDTSPDMSGKDVKPRVIEEYDGGDIALNGQLTMKVSDFPELAFFKGHTLIHTDGTTLLGADDKAGVAEIMTAAEYLLTHPEVKHGKIRIGFTPDEEVGGLAKDLDLDRFGARVAYTLDGDYLGYYEDETFNASHATALFRGRSVHTGTAKGIMVNAGDLAAEFVSLLPPGEKPQFTEGREGFFHLVSIQANVELAQVDLIVRDHDAGVFARREQLLRDLAAQMARKYGPKRVSLTITPTYRNMKEVIDQYPFLIDNLTKAISLAGLTPRSLPFRGGTDGSALSHRGLPCPNLSAGYENAHGRFEYVPIRSMEKNVEILLHLARLFGEMKE